jgi:transcriptional regulator with XRE-family HTH domain
MIPESTSQAARRRELAAFLRSRRERVSPSSVGLSNGLRRRTPGLRREEVAELAGVGVTWYTWLEQARAVNPSVEVLGALADTLRLDAAERRHLFVLADRPPALLREAGPEVVTDPIRRMLDSLEGQPALVTGRRWDILAWNRAAEAVFGDYRRLEGDARNMMHLVFADAAHRAMLMDWRSIAATALATFRADYAIYRGDPDFDRLIAKLKAASGEFREWWGRQDVLPPLPGCKRIAHPVAGRLAFEYTTFAVADAVGLRLAVYTPLAEQDTERKLGELMRNADRRRRARKDAPAMIEDST